MSMIEHSLSRKARWCGAALGLLATPLLVWGGNAVAAGDANFNCCAEFTFPSGATSKACTNCGSNEFCGEPELKKDGNGKVIGVRPRCISQNTPPIEP